MQPFKPSPATCPPRPNGKRPCYRRRQTPKGKKVSMMTKKLVKKRKRHLTKSQKRMLLMPKLQMQIKLMDKSRHRLRRLMQVIRSLLAEQRLRRKRRMAKMKIWMMSMTAITMKKVAISGGPREKTGSSITRRTRKLTRLVFPLCRNA